MISPVRLSRTLSLRAAASVVFALVALLPILLLVYFLSWADLLRYTAAQLGVLVAVGVSVVGFLVFRRLVSQIARLAETVQASAAGKPVVLRDESSAVVPRLAEVTEIGQLTAAFRQMVDDLRGATQRLEDLVFKLGTLNETVELAARVPRMQDLLTLVLQNTMRAVRASRGSIMMLDPERQVLKVVVAQDIPADIASRVEVKLGEGISGKVAAEGEPILVEDIETDPRFGRQSAPQYGSGAFICMPIRVANRIIGVINLAKKKPEAGAASLAPFSPIDLQFLNALLTYVGYSVENARLLQEARQSAQRLHGVVEDLKTTQAQLVRGETLRAIGQLASGMAHHLNNLFAVIVGRAELALRTGARANVSRTLEIILRTARDGAEVVRRVQRFGRAEPVSPATAVDLDEVVHEVVELARPHWQDEAQRRGCSIEIALELGAVPPAAGEAGPLREVLINLMLNAIEALREGGVITIRTWAAEDRIHCAVTDNGVGMSEDTRRRALEPFFTTKGPKSTGLGLSVGYGTIQRYGGTLQIDSAEGQGTTVTVSLPMGIEKKPPQPGADLEPALKGLRVLVIDDEPEVRAVLAEILAADGHHVLQAGGGREGLDLLTSGQEVDIVLTDLGMPEMSGSDTAQAIRDRWPRLPVGLVTGWEEAEVTPEERRHASFVIHKPFDPTRIHQALSGIASPL